MDAFLNHPTYPFVFPFGQILIKPFLQRSGGSYSPSPSSNNMRNNIIAIIIIILAIYFALKCKKNGKIDPVQIGMATVFSPFYIGYRLVKPCS